MSVHNSAISSILTVKLFIRSKLEEKKSLKIKRRKSTEEESKNFLSLGRSKPCTRIREKHRDGYLRRESTKEYAIHIYRYIHIYVYISIYIHINTYKYDF